MQANRISAVLPNGALAEAKDHLAKLRALLAPVLIGLTEKERRNLPKMGDKTLPFGSKTSLYFTTYPQFAPGYLDLAELKKDLDLAEALRPVLKELNTLRQNVDDTVMLASSEALTASLYYYNSVKYAAEKGNLDAKTIYADLAKRFKQDRGNNGDDGKETPGQP